MRFQSRSFHAATALAVLTFSAHARTFECRTTDGAYRPPGATTVASAAKRDQNILGSVFSVNTSQARVSGPSLFRTEEQRVEVLKNSDDEFEVLWRSKQNDLTTLRISKFDDAWTFTYYSGWQSLLLAGSCRVV